MLVHTYLFSQSLSQSIVQYTVVEEGFSRLSLSLGFSFPFKANQRQELHTRMCSAYARGLCQRSFAVGAAGAEARLGEGGEITVVEVGS